MNYVDFVDGVWYPKGGIYKLIEALVTIAKKNNADLRTNTEVASIIVENGKAVGVRLSSGEELRADYIVSNADYEHTEMKLLPPDSREHSEKYWDTRTLAPSAFIMYLGVDGKAPTLTHHNLLFSADWIKNFKQIFDTVVWPDSPSIYVSKPSESDDSVAPAGTENMFVLVPIGSGLTYTDAEMKAYGDKVLSIIEKSMNVPDLSKRLLYRRDYCVKDFAKDYNSYKGTALGPAHTLMQTAFFRPNNVSKKVKNLFFVGAYTNPGIGMPVCMISAELVYKRIEGTTDPSPLQSL
jgi:phytoene desaturase